MESVERKLKEFGKAETKNLMSRLANTKYKGGSVREHLMGLMDIAAKLNRLKEDWTMDDLITIVVLEENRTNAYGGVVNVQSQSQKNNPLDVIPTTEFKCYFCQKEGHIKKNCKNYKKWFEKNKNKDTGASIHIAHNVQEFTRRREPRKHEVKVFVGNGELSRLGFVFQFNKDCFALSQNSNVLASGFLSNGLYCLNYNKEGEVVMAESSEERIRGGGTSTRLWHRRLGHISKERMKILVKEQIMPSLTFGDDGICIECDKGKLTKTKKKGATRNSDLLQIIHTDICGPFPHQTIDDHSQRQLEKKIKIVRTNRRVVQYTMPGTSQQNGVVERKNRTLKDMFIEDEENATRNEDFIFEEEGDVAMIEGISGSENLSNRFEEPVDQQEQAVNNPELDNPQELITCADFDIGDEADPTNFKEAIESQNADKWRDSISSKWAFKAKKDKDGRIERFKARLVAKGFIQKEAIDYIETFSLVSTKDSFRIIMALEGKEHMVYKLGKAIYGLKQANRSFEENIADQCIYLKKCGSRFIFLVLYIDDILLATDNDNLLKDTKELLSNNFEMKDLGEASFVLGIEIQRDRARSLLGLSQKTYIERILKRFDMRMCYG
ncbi:unnamed protein product [Prunus armeniaca]